MTEKTTPKISILAGQKHIVVNSEIDAAVHNNPVHLATMIDQGLLSSLREQDLHLLTGPYRMSVTLVVTKLQDQDAVSEPEDK